MTGPEHYREAERLLAEAKASVQPGAPVADVQVRIDLARVHAALADVAARVHPFNPHPGDKIGRAWIEVTS